MKLENFSGVGHRITQDSLSPKDLLTWQSPTFLFFPLDLFLGQKCLLSWVPPNCLAMACDVVHNMLPPKYGALAY